MRITRFNHVNYVNQIRSEQKRLGDAAVSARRETTRLLAVIEHALRHDEPDAARTHLLSCYAAIIREMDGLVSVAHEGHKTLKKLHALRAAQIQERFDAECRRFGLE